MTPSCVGSSHIGCLLHLPPSRADEFPVGLVQAPEVGPFNSHWKETPRGKVMKAGLLGWGRDLQCFTSHFVLDPLLRCLAAATVEMSWKSLTLPRPVAALSRMHPQPERIFP